jgi:hypothetical protein
MPTPPVPIETVALVRKLAGQGVSLRRIVRLTRDAGCPLGITSVKAIVGRRGSSGSPRAPLKTGERRLSQPITCDGCGGRIDTVPCRICAALQTIEKMRAMNQHVSQLSPAARVTRRTRQRVPGQRLPQEGDTRQLELELTDDHRQRQEAVQARKRAAGELPWPRDGADQRQAALDRDIADLAGADDTIF